MFSLLLLAIACAAGPDETVTGDAIRFEVYDYTCDGPSASFAPSVSSDTPVIVTNMQNVVNDAGQPPRWVTGDVDITPGEGAVVICGEHVAGGRVTIGYLVTE